MSKSSVKKLINEYNIQASYEELNSLNISHIKLRRYVQKIYNYGNKYYNGDRIITYKYLKKHLDKYLRRAITNKVTLETFECIGYSNVEYHNYCKNKTKIITSKSKIYGKLGAIEAIKDRKTNPEKYIGIQTNQKEYWIKKGYSEIEAKEKVSERQRTFSLEKCIKKHGLEKGQEVFNQRQIKWQETLNSKPQEEIDRINMSKNILLRTSKETNIAYIIRIARHKIIKKKISNDPCTIAKCNNTKRKNGVIIPDEDRTDFELYSVIVRKMTEKQPLHTLSNIQLRGQKDNNFHLDHKFSIFEGFKNNIPTYIISNIINLEMIPARTNNSKGIYCSIEKNMLLSAFFNK